jgi:hypothetical protein
MKFKLVHIENGQIITGEALKTRLEKMSFAVTQLPELPYCPPAPVQADFVQANGMWDVEGHHAAYRAWLTDYFYPRQEVLASRPALVRPFAVDLKTKYKLVIASYGKTGAHTKDGRPVIDWFIQEKPGYNYTKCAMKLMGLLTFIPLDIDFVCFGQFG